MSNQNSTSDKQLQKVERQIIWSIWIAAALIVTVLCAYFINFHMNFSDKNDEWGTFGDFIGGTLNPVLAALAFYWLTSSIRLQLQELKDTRKVLEDTADHQDKIAKLDEQNVNTQKKILDLQTESLNKQIQASELQQQQISIQNFENLFFELLKSKNDAINEITYDYITINNADNHVIRGKNAIRKYIESFNKYEEENSWEEHYTRNLLHIFDSYFRISYQIVKLIDNNITLNKFEKSSYKDYSLKQKEYFDLFRSTLTQHELEAFFYNCLSSYGNKKFKRLMEKYGLLEPLLMINSSKSNDYHQPLRYAYQYNRDIFEENEDWKEYFKDLDQIDTSVDHKDINKNIKHLIKTGVHIGFNGKSHGLLSFEKINNKIAEKVELFSEKFKNTKNISDLSSELQQQHSELHVFKTVAFTYEMYMILKYGIDLEDYIRTKFAELTQLDNPPQQS